MEYVEDEADPLAQPEPKRSRLVNKSRSKAAPAVEEEEDIVAHKRSTGRRVIDDDGDD